MTTTTGVRATTQEPYGPASQAHYADPGYQADGQKRYPLDSEAHCRAAWSYINMPKNAGKYTADQLSKIKARIKAAGHKYGIDFADDGRASATDSEYRRTTPGMCTRAFDFTQDGPGDGRTLEGYAAVFNSPARIKDLQGDFDEVILRGAFERSLARRMPVLQWDHGKDPRIGTAPIGDIHELREDDHGLYVRAELYDHPDIERIRLPIKGKSVRGMSFRFGVPQGGDKWTRRSGDVDLRAISEADTYELGPVVFAAYDTTSVSVRSILAGLDPAEMRELVHELAEHLRSAVDLTDLTGRSGTWSADGGEPDVPPQEGDTSPVTPPQIRDRLLAIELRPEIRVPS